jgi:hypothetical protein
MRSATELPPPFQPPVGACFHPGESLAGHLAVQPWLRTSDGKAKLSDDVLGHGFTVFSLVKFDAPTAAAVSELKGAIGLRSVIVGDEGVQEEGETLSQWLRHADVVAALVRPDFYVFGTATEISEVPGLLASLRDCLSLV